MKVSNAALPRLRLGTLIAFTAASAVVLAYLWTHSGGTLPLQRDGYEVTVQSDDMQNLVANSDVMIAGVKVGSVKSITGPGDHAKAVLSLDSDVTPLHEGATFALRSKTLVEETYLDITDGTGESLDSGETLPISAMTSSVHLDQVLNELTPESRNALTDLIRTSGQATKGRSDDIDSLMRGLGAIGGPGNDALAALADQQEDLDQLSRTSARVLAAFDERQGQAAHLVGVAQQNMKATADQRIQLVRTMTQLPGLLDTARSAAPALETLAADLRPLAASLKTAAPALNEVLAKLPETTRELRATFPTLSTVLRKAPATLTRVRPLGDAITSVVPEAQAALAEINPMIAYVSPYGMDLAAFFANDSSAFGLQDETSRFVRVFAVLNSTSLVGNPIPTTGIGGVGQNPYPGAGSAGNPKINFSGDYPRVQREKP
ncbi:MlaD family protein [Nocardioides sp.]|uniref:MlaD family protein n=1 Tax=Nocardioides sp. TaxID=35761 RepID=UPI00321AFD74